MIPEESVESFADSPWLNAREVSRSRDDSKTPVSSKSATSRLKSPKGRNNR